MKGFLVLNDFEQRDIHLTEYLVHWILLWSAGRSSPGTSGEGNVTLAPCLAPQGTLFYMSY